MLHEKAIEPHGEQQGKADRSVVYRQRAPRRELLTLKLQNTFKDCMHILACSSVEVERCGDDYKIYAHPPDARELAKEFLVSNADNTEYNVAFVENQNGATTQVIRPRGPNGKSK